MFKLFKEAPHGCFDRQLGRKYRDQILGAGATVDGMEMATAFLGRPPSSAAFLEAHGIGDNSSTDGARL
jgi:Zn-dependent oligopeptidase